MPEGVSGRKMRMVGMMVGCIERARAPVASRDANIAAARPPGTAAERLEIKWISNVTICVVTDIPLSASHAGGPASVTGCVSK